MNYYKRIGGTTEGKKHVIQGWIYPETYQYTFLRSPRTVKEKSTNCTLWQQVTKEEHEQWAIEKAKELYPVGTVVTNNKYNYRVESENIIISDSGYFILADGLTVYNLETGEWAEIVSKAEDKFQSSNFEFGDIYNPKPNFEKGGIENLNKIEPQKGRKSTILFEIHIKRLSEIPEARKLLEEWGVIERDYVKEVFSDNITPNFRLYELLDDYAMTHKYCDLSIEDACRYIVEGFERDNE